MFAAVPPAALKTFGPQVEAQLREFFTLKNLEITAAIFTAEAAVQAVPGADADADAVVDIALFSLVLVQFG